MRLRSRLCVAQRARALISGRFSLIRILHPSDPLLGQPTERQYAGVSNGLTELNAKLTKAPVSTIAQHRGGREGAWASDLFTALSRIPYIAISITLPATITPTRFSKRAIRAQQRYKAISDTHARLAPRISECEAYFPTRINRFPCRATPRALARIAAHLIDVFISFQSSMIKPCS